MSTDEAYAATQGSEERMRLFIFLENTDLILSRTAALDRGSKPIEISASWSMIFE